MTDRGTFGTNGRLGKEARNLPVNGLYAVSPYQVLGCCIAGICQDAAFFMLKMLQGMATWVLAINYHLDPSNETAGCWKQFKTDADALKWLQWRISKTAASAKGMVRFDSLEALNNDRKVSVNISLNKAIDSFLSFRAVHHIGIS